MVDLGLVGTGSIVDSGAWSMSGARHIGVVTVTYNSAAVLPEFLECAFRQTFREFILYVVDNASTDSSIAIVSGCKDSRIRILHNAENVGVAEGNNQGIRAAIADGCDAVLFLNNDTAFGEDLFAHLYAGLDLYGCDMTSGKMNYYDLSDVIWCAGGWFDERKLFSAFHYGMGEKDAGQYDQPRRVTYTPTCCLLVRSSVFHRVGLMDCKYFVYGDDVDFLYRCLQDRVSLWYLPEAKLYHKVSSLTGGDTSEFAIWYMTRNRMYFLRKHRPAWQAWLWAAHFMVYTAPLRLLLCRDSLRICRLRCAALREGWRLASELCEKV